MAVRVHSGTYRVAAVFMVLVAVTVVAATAVAAYRWRASTTVADGGASSATLQSPAPTTPPVALWVGDSYTAGYGASASQAGYAGRVCRRVGWVCKLDAQGGTGFINNGRRLNESFGPASSRVAQDAKRYLADVVVIDFGRNDGWHAGVEKAMQAYVRQVARAWPDATLVMIVPFYLSSDGEVPYPDLVSSFKETMGQFEGYVVDPYAEKWFDGTSEDLLFEDKIHPNDAGYEFIADQITSTLVGQDVPAEVKRSVEEQRG